MDAVAIAAALNLLRGGPGGADPPAEERGMAPPVPRAAGAQRGGEDGPPGAVAQPRGARAPDDAPLGRGSAACALAGLSSDGTHAPPPAHGAPSAACAGAQDASAPAQPAAGGCVSQRGLTLHIVEHTVHRIDHIQSTPSVDLRRCAGADATEAAHNDNGCSEHVEMVVSNLRLFSLSVALFDAEGERVCRTADDRELVMRADLIYENGQPVEQLGAQEPPLVGKTELAVVCGQANFRLRITSLSSHRDRQRFRVRVTAHDARTQAAEPGLFAVTKPMKCVTKLGTPKAGSGGGGAERADLGSMAAQQQPQPCGEYAGGVVMASVVHGASVGPYGCAPLLPMGAGPGHGAGCCMGGAVGCCGMGAVAQLGAMPPGMLVLHAEQRPTGQPAEQRPTSQPPSCQLLRPAGACGAPYAWGQPQQPQREQPPCEEPPQPRPKRDSSALDERQPQPRAKRSSAPADGGADARARAQRSETAQAATAAAAARRAHGLPEGLADGAAGAGWGAGSGAGAGAVPGPLAAQAANGASGGAPARGGGGGALLCELRSVHAQIEAELAALKRTVVAATHASVAAQRHGGS